MRGHGYHAEAYRGHGENDGHDGHRGPPEALGINVGSIGAQQYDTGHEPKRDTPDTGQSDAQQYRAQDGQYEWPEAHEEGKYRLERPVDDSTQRARLAQVFDQREF